MNITEVIDRHAATQGTRPFIIHDTGSWTWSELRNYVDSVAATLVDAGVKDGDVVGHLFQNELLKVLVCLATGRLGATTVSISAATPIPKCQRTMQDVCASQVLTDIADLENKLTLPVFFLSFETLNLEDNSVSLLNLNPKGLLLIVEGSGTTGTPKYIPLTHEVIARRSEATARFTIFDCNDTFFNLIKFDFYSAKQRFFDCLFLAASFWIPVNEKVDLRKAALASKYNVLFGTVFHIEKYLATLADDVSDYLSPLKTISLGSSTVSSNLRMRIRWKLCPRLQVRYGTNESSSISITSLDDVYSVEGGVGRPLPGVEIEILDSSNRIVPDGEPGIIRVRGEVCISGYWNNPEATAKNFKDGWFYPGDICCRTKDGQLIHLGRSDDLMIRNGINIYPGNVEEALLKHPDVIEACVFPVSDPIEQDVPVAMVVSKKGPQTSETALLKMVRQSLGSYALSRVFLTDSMPRNDQGKIPAAAARKMIEDHQAELELCASRAKSVEGKLRNQNRQLLKKLTIMFRVPAEANFVQIDNWFAALSQDNDWPALPSEAHQSHILAELWMARALRLTIILLQAAKVPVFEEPLILNIRPRQLNSNLWLADAEFPQIDQFSASHFNEILKKALRYLEWMATNQITAENRSTLFQSILDKCVKPTENVMPRGASTYEVLKAAFLNQIPFRYLGSAVYQLGWGAKSTRIDRSTTLRDAAMGQKLAGHKAQTGHILRLSGLPAPSHQVVRTIGEATTVATKMGFPIVIKPADSERGIGVSLDVTADDLGSAFESAFAASRSNNVLVERQVPGVCHRIFIARGQLLYAVKRLPIGVYGDGVRSIEQLVNDVIAADAQNPSWKRSKLKPIDELARHSIKSKWGTEHSIPKSGEFIGLRRFETNAWGGLDEDVSNCIHPENVRVAIAAASALGLDVAGVDIISDDIARPWHENDAIINEVNFAPLLGGGDISRANLDQYLKRILGGDGRVPIEVFVGGEAAWQAATKRQREFSQLGLKAFVTNSASTKTPDFQEQVIPSRFLYDRVTALLLSSNTDALLIVVQSDELLRRGLPTESVDKVNLVDDELYSVIEPSTKISAESKFALIQKFSHWCR